MDGDIVFPNRHAVDKTSLPRRDNLDGNVPKTPKLRPRGRTAEEHQGEKQVTVLHGRVRPYPSCLQVPRKFRVSPRQRLAWGVTHASKIKATENLELRNSGEERVFPILPLFLKSVFVREIYE